MSNKNDDDILYCTLERPLLISLEKDTNATEIQPKLQNNEAAWMANGDDVNASCFS